MKRLLFLGVSILAECCSSGILHRDRTFHSELNTAISDLTKAPTWARQAKALVRINMAVLGGSELTHTNYSLADIVHVVRQDKLEAAALENDWFGIQHLLGINPILLKKSNE